MILRADLSEVMDMEGASVSIEMPEVLDARLPFPEESLKVPWATLIEAEELLLSAGVKVAE